MKFSVFSMQETDKNAKKAVPRRGRHECALVRGYGSLWCIRSGRPAFAQTFVLIHAAVGNADEVAERIGLRGLGGKNACAGADVTEPGILTVQSVDG